MDIWPLISKDISDQTPLSPTDLLDVYTSIAAAHTKEERDQYYQHVVVSNLRLVRSIALTFSDPPPLLDRLQVGAIGLIQAAFAFDPTRQVSFTHFAYSRIHGAITDFCTSQKSLLTLSRPTVRELSSLEHTITALQEQTGRFPTKAALQEALGVSEEHLSTLLAMHSEHALREMITIDSFEQEMSDDIEDTHWQTAQEDVEQSALRHELERLIDRLSPKRRAVIQLLYGLGRAGYPHSPADVVEILGFATLRQVTKLHYRALQQLAELALAAQLPAIRSLLVQELRQPEPEPEEDWVTALFAAVSLQQHDLPVES